MLEKCATFFSLCNCNYNCASQFEWFKVQDCLYSVTNDKNLRFILSPYDIQGIFLSSACSESLRDGRKFPWPSVGFQDQPPTEKDVKRVSVCFVWRGQRSHFRATHTNSFLRTFLYFFRVASVHGREKWAEKGWKTSGFIWRPKTFRV